MKKQAGRPIVLDRELCFKKWVEMRTLKNVSRWFAEQGIVNPFTEKPYSAAAISYAAGRWVVEHPEEARPYYNHYGWYPDDDTWNRFLIRKALKCFHSHGREPLKNLLESRGLREEYGYLLGD